jgi:hypothetical protein
MPGKKHMNQDRPANGQDTLQTMQDKSGIYQDRTDGKLPQGRVAQHYQAMDAKMEQEKKKPKNTSGIFGGDTIFGDENNDGNMLSRALRKADAAVTGGSGGGMPGTPTPKKSKFEKAIISGLNKVFY